jgi:hypothetical protein
VSEKLVEPKRPISVRAPVALDERMARSARENRRSKTAEWTVAAEQYLNGKRA